MYGLDTKQLAEEMSGFPLLGGKVAFLLHRKMWRWVLSLLGERWQKDQNMVPGG